MALVDSYTDISLLLPRNLHQIWFLKPSYQKWLEIKLCSVLKHSFTLFFSCVNFSLARNLLLYTLYNIFYLFGHMKPILTEIWAKMLWKCSIDRMQYLKKVHSEKHQRAFEIFLYRPKELKIQWIPSDCVLDYFLGPSIEWSGGNKWYCSS